VIELRSDFAVRINGLKYSYPDGTPALRGIDLAVRRGESVALVGPNGAGKSTLMMHLNGILMGEGRVEVMGVEVNKKTLGQVRSIVGLVFQDPDDQLFSPTVRDDVAFGPMNMRMPIEQVDAAVKKALEAVGMEGSEDRSPHHMSFGEKKRVSLATVLSMDPDILALDEPAANMDPRGRREFIELLCFVSVTRLLVTHDLDMARRLCPRTIVMEKGLIVADGATSNLLSDKDFLYRSGLA